MSFVYSSSKYTVSTAGDVSANSIILQSTEDSISTSSGALQVAGGISVSKNVYVGSRLSVLSDSSFIGSMYVESSSQSTSTTSGALRVVGGAAVGGNVSIGGNTSIAQSLSVADTLSVSSDASFGGKLSLNSSEISSSTSTGAFTVAGGVGIGGDVHVRNNVTLVDPSFVDLTNNLVFHVVGDSIIDSTNVLNRATGSVIAGANLAVDTTDYVVGSGSLIVDRIIGTSISAQSVVDTTLNPNYTLCAWLKPMGLADTSACVILSLSEGVSEQFVLSLGNYANPLDSLSNVRVSGKNGVSSGLFSQDSSDNILFRNGWIHISIIFGNSNIWTLYVNGNLYGRFTNANLIGANYSGSYSKFFETDAAKRFNGRANDIRLYSVALTAEQIARVFEYPRSRIATKNVISAGIYRGLTNVTYNSVLVDGSASSVSGFEYRKIATVNASAPMTGLGGDLHIQGTMGTVDATGRISINCTLGFRRSGTLYPVVNGTCSYSGTYGTTHDIVVYYIPSLQRYDVYIKYTGSYVYNLTVSASRQKIALIEPSDSAKYVNPAGVQVILSALNLMNSVTEGSQFTTRVGYGVSDPSGRLHISSRNIEPVRFALKTHSLLYTDSSYGGTLSANVYGYADISNASVNGNVYVINPLNMKIYDISLQGLSTVSERNYIIRNYTDNTLITNNTELTGNSFFQNNSVTSSAINNVYRITEDIAEPIRVDDFLANRVFEVSRRGNVFVGGRLDVTGDTSLNNMQIRGQTTMDGSLNVTGRVIVNNTIESSATNVGALTVSGGVGVGGNMFVGKRLDVTGDSSFNNVQIRRRALVDGSLVVTGITVINSTVESTATNVGALTVSGGVGIAGRIFAGRGMDVSGDTSLNMLRVRNRALVDGSLVVTDVTVMNSTLESTATNVGALTVSGGVGVAGRIFAGRGMDVTGDTSLNMLRVRNRALVDGSLVVTGITVINSTIESTATNVGALTVSGGVGVGGRIFVGRGMDVTGDTSLNMLRVRNRALVDGSLVVTDVTVMNSTVESTATNVGALTVSGGVGVAGRIFVGRGMDVTGDTSLNMLRVRNRALVDGSLVVSNIVVINSTQPSTSTNTGALTVSGGIGVAGNVYVGGNLNVVPSASVNVRVDSISQVTVLSKHDRASNHRLSDAASLPANTDLSLGTIIRKMGDASSTEFSTIQLQAGVSGEMNLLIGVGGNTTVQRTYLQSGMAYGSSADLVYTQNETLSLQPFGGRVTVGKSGYNSSDWEGLASLDVSGTAYFNQSISVDILGNKMSNIGFTRFYPAVTRTSTNDFRNQGVMLTDGSFVGQLGDASGDTHSIIRITAGSYGGMSMILSAGGNEARGRNVIQSGYTYRGTGSSDYTPNYGINNILSLQPLGGRVTVGKSGYNTSNWSAGSTLDVSGTFNVNGTSTLGNTTVSGSLSVTGGFSANGGLTATTMSGTGLLTVASASINGTLNVASGATFGTSSLVKINSEESSLNTNSGALVVTGGVGIGGSLNIGNTLDCSENVRFYKNFVAGKTVSGTGRFKIFGTDSITENMIANTPITINTYANGLGGANDAATMQLVAGSYSSRSMIFSSNNTARNIQAWDTQSNSLLSLTFQGKGGNVGVGVNNFSPSSTLDVSGTFRVNGTSTLGNTTISGSLSVAGSFSATGGLNASGISSAGLIRFTNATSSTNTNTGALVVNGGVGIGENLNVSGSSTISGSLSVSGNLTLNGTTVNLSDVAFKSQSNTFSTNNLFNSGINLYTSTDIFKGFFGNENDAGYYFLPYSSTRRLMILFGEGGDASRITITFVKAFVDNVPKVFLTRKYDEGQGGGGPVVYSISTTTLVVDGNVNEGNKAAFYWIAFGLTTIN